MKPLQFPVEVIPCLLAVAGRCLKLAGCKEDPCKLLHTHGDRQDLAKHRKAGTLALEKEHSKEAARLQKAQEEEAKLAAATPATEHTQKGKRAQTSTLQSTFLEDQPGPLGQISIVDNIWAGKTWDVVLNRSSVVITAKERKDFLEQFLKMGAHCGLDKTVYMLALAEISGDPKEAKEKTIFDLRLMPASFTASWGPGKDRWTVLPSQVCVYFKADAKFYYNTDNICLGAGDRVVLERALQSFTQAEVTPVLKYAEDPAAKRLQCGAATVSKHKSIAQGDLFPAVMGTVRMLCEACKRSRKGTDVWQKAKCMKLGHAFTLSTHAYLDKLTEEQRARMDGCRRLFFYEKLYLKGGLIELRV
ncbi:hypothetical protein BDK51DRAFT_27697 [Blyttiomyces helicus]|uniref:Uncharacterized protein n=1 Tax=Blyttiomyces helicus TaxID=388810 RepID=A0A4P9WM97_9FUNG|nr:hypothetical protein BDK51DRAFT_27697 [Blyttiomyces helicus]|eukprot:RKO91836.1 hypothetical protein BDK51DRAFT_27697 [Blyttiomyces helicus]